MRYNAYIYRLACKFGFHLRDKQNNFLAYLFFYQTMLCLVVVVVFWNKYTV